VGEGEAPETARDRRRPRASKLGNSHGCVPGSDFEECWQMRLHDGTRITQRFNLSHTVGHIYAYVASGQLSPPVAIVLR
jgi:hypothetical protein